MREPSPNRPIAVPPCQPTPIAPVPSSDGRTGARRKPRRVELPTADALLLTAFRMGAQGAARWSLVVDGFHNALGEEAAPYALHGIRCMLEILDGAARRRFEINPPGHPAVTASERALLTAIAALQRGRKSHADAVLSWLLPLAPRIEAAKHAFWIAAGLKGRRLMVSLPDA